MTEPRFAVNVPATTEWLIHRIAVEEGEIADDGAQPMTNPIHASWSPRDYGLNDADNLVNDAANEYGFITGPEGMRVVMDTIGDVTDSGDGDGYRWLVMIDKPAPLIIASQYETQNHLGDRDAAPGADSAMSVLCEAVDQANRLLAELAAYMHASA
jgi:hypothetical protein